MVSNDGWNVYQAQPLQTNDDYSAGAWDSSYGQDYLNWPEVPAATIWYGDHVKEDATLWQDWYSGDYWCLETGTEAAPEPELSIWFNLDSNDIYYDQDAANSSSEEEEPCEPDPEWTPGVYWLPIFFGRGGPKGRKG